MAHQPTDPKSLQIINRIYDVLRAIQAGENYFYTPFKVARRFMDYNECEGYPTYSVFRGEPAGGSAYAGENLWDEDFFINIYGIIQHDSDTVTVMERAIADIRKAIDDDSRSGAANTLGDGVMCVDVRFDEPPWTDEGILSNEGFGFFHIRLRVIMSGEYGEI